MSQLPDQLLKSANIPMMMQMNPNMGMGVPVPDQKSQPNQDTSNYFS